ncbi:MAG: hypothetical protein U1D55_16320 [Phycisphaerae bacterium]
MLTADVFEVYRTALFLALTIYYAIVTVASAWQVALLLRGNDQARRFLRVYLGYQLLSIRIRRFAPELVQMAAWTIALGLLYWAHYSLE